MRPIAFGCQFGAIRNSVAPFAIAISKRWATRQDLALEMTHKAQLYNRLTRDKKVPGRIYRCVLKRLQQGIRPDRIAPPDQQGKQRFKECPCAPPTHKLSPFVGSV